MAIEILPNGICKIDNRDYPAVGFGTYPYKDKICEKAVKEAAKFGYRIIDTATYYNNFNAISQALKDYGRENFYIISKVWPDSHNREGIFEDIKRTLDQLETHYLDAYLLHWPNSKTSIEETLYAMQELKSQGLIRHIGLSNVTVNHLKRALEVKVPISWVQVEMHPEFYEPELLEFCKKNSIVVQAWRPLNLGRVNQNPLLQKIGKKQNKTPCQIALRWILQLGCLPLPGSQNEKHIQENFDFMDFSLSDEEMLTINKQAENGTRVRITEEDALGISDEFDYTYEECWPIKR